MRSKILYLITSIFLLVIFNQCEDSLTITANQDQNNELTEVSLSTPQDGSDQNTAVEFDWSQLDEADSYEFQLSAESEFSSVIVDSLTEESSFQIKGLPSDTTLYWQVRPVIDGEEGPWSTTWQFFTESDSENAEPVATDLTSPSDGASKSPYSVKFSWTAVASASAYNVQVASDQEFSSLVIDQEVTSSSYETTELSAEQTFYWRIEPVVSGEETQWSDVFQFSTLAEDEIPAPVQVSPDDGATDVALQPTFEWEDVDGADYYILHSNSVDPYEMVVNAEVEGTTFTPGTELATQKRHDWRVRAVIGDTKGEWSEIHTFVTGSGESDDSTDAGVSLHSPSDGSSNQSTNLTLDWETVSGASEYQVQVAQDNSFSSPVYDEAVTESSYDLSGLDYSQTYYWRVQVNNDGDSENWSSVYSFITESQSTNDDNGDYANSVEGDRQALEDLYNATNGANWNNNSGWLSGNPSDNWHGIEVNSEGRVVRVDLFKNGLSGSLPESIGNLTAVTYLNVKNNHLSGHIPSSIGNMKSLEWLVLSGNPELHGQTFKQPPEDLVNDGYHPGKRDKATNDFSGSIPSSIGNLANLEIFELAGTSITHIPEEIGNLTSLRGLYLNWNVDLDQEIPSSISNLSNLRHLMILNSGLKGTLPKGMSNLTKLTRIKLGSESSSNNNGLGTNHLTGSLPDFSKLTELRSIVLDRNDFDGEWPHYWNNGNFTHLNTLRASWNNFTGTLHGFDNLPGMRSFALGGNSLSGEIPQSITNIGNGGCIIIALGWNNFTGELPQTGWADFSQMRLIYLNDNNLTGHIPGDFFDGVDNPDLKWLYLQNNEFSSVDRTAMNNVSSPKLQTIDISGNNF